MASGWMGAIEAFSPRMDACEEVCDLVHIGVSVLVSFSQIDKGLVKTRHHGICTSEGVLDCGFGAGRRVSSMDVKEIINEAAVAFDDVFCLVCLNIPQVLLADIFCWCCRGGVGLNGSIWHCLEGSGCVFLAKEGVWK